MASATNIIVKSILNKKKRRDSWFLDDYTLNPYSACSFNCLYCYTQGSKYGHNMEEKVSVKINAPEILEKQLHTRAKKKEYGFIVFSSASDPYLHFEKDTQLTRSLLEIILKYKFPVHMLTRSPLILRDLDLLHQINKEAILPIDLNPKLNKHKAIISFSFSTLDQEVAKIFEPGNPLISDRLNTMQTVINEGFKSGISMMPLIPYISDTGESLHHMFKTFANIKAHYILASTITLFGNERGNSKWLMYRAIEKQYPHLLEKYKKFFDHSDYMPAYYNTAFMKKINELCLQYGIRNRIV